MWVPLSVLTAFFFAASGALSKRITQKASHYTVTWVMFSFALPWIIFYFIKSDVPRIEPSFIWALCGSLILNMVAVTLFVKAIHLSPLNITYPFVSFTPVFLVLTGYIFLGEFPSRYGIAGILLVALGTYVIFAAGSGSGVMEPFRRLIDDKGALLMLIVAFIWSFAAAFDKVAVISSSPSFYTFSFNTGFTLCYMPFLIKMRPGFIGEIKDNLTLMLLLGLTGALLFISQMTALDYAHVSYVIAIKRGGMLFSVIFGIVFFRERLTYTRTAGIFLMLCGMVLIMLFA
ncbi:MAG: DMT family transporter [Elusimicrobiota bacterium]